MKKKLTILFLQISLVWMGISVLTDSVSGAKKDAARALELLRQARAAIGGEEAVKNVQNISYKGKSKRIIKIKNQADREVTGDVEMAVLLPDQIYRMEKLGIDDVNEGSETLQTEAAPAEKNVIVEVRDEDAIGEKAVTMHRDNEMLRFTLGFLLSAPKDENISYDYTGEESIDGRAVNVIAVSSNGNSLMRLYLDKQTNLPVMMSYKGFSHHAPMFFERHAIDVGTGKIVEQGDKDIIILREPASAGEGKNLPEKVVLERSKNVGVIANGEGQKFEVRLTAPPMDAEIQLKFSDYRAVNGIKLPHQLTEVVNGVVEQTTTIDGYEINVPNMAERFKQNPVRIKVRRPE